MIHHWPKGLHLFNLHTMLRARYFPARYLWWAMLLGTLLLFLRFYFRTSAPTSYHRTIGWGWDITPTIWWSTGFVVVVSFGLFTLLYGILALRQRQLPTVLALLQLFLLLLAMLSPWPSGYATLVFVAAWLVSLLHLVVHRPLVLPAQEWEV